MNLIEHSNSTINRSKHSKYVTIKCNKIKINKITITFSPFNRFMLFKDTLHVSTITLISQSKSPHEIPASVFRHEARNLLNIVVISLIYLSLQYFTKYFVLSVVVKCWIATLKQNEVLSSWKSMICLKYSLFWHETR